MCMACAWRVNLGPADVGEEGLEVAQHPRAVGGALEPPGCPGPGPHRLEAAHLDPEHLEVAQEVADLAVRLAEGQPRDLAQQVGLGGGGGRGRGVRGG